MNKAQSEIRKSESGKNVAGNGWRVAGGGARLTRHALLATVLALGWMGAAQAQTTVFSENFGSPSATTTITSYASGTAPATFQNKGTLTYAQGDQTTPADVRNSNASSGYTGASGTGNIFFTSTSGVYGFSIESINASTFSSLQLTFAYRKESGTVLPSFAVDYWNGTVWVTLGNTSAALFNEAANAATGWYLSKTLTLPVAAQINGLKIRFVKSGTASTRIDDVKLAGIPSTPTISSTVSSLSGFFTVSTVASESQSVAVSGVNLTADVTVAASTGFQVSTDNSTFGTSVTLTPSGGSVSSVPVYVRVASGGTAGAVSGTLTLASTGATNQTVTLSGTVNGVVALPFGIQNFETNSSPFYSYSVAGNRNWNYVTNSTLGLGTNNLVTNRVMEINGFGGDVAANDWLILGPIDCSTANNPVVSFNSLNRFTPPSSELQLKVSSTYPGTGNPTNSTWAVLTNWTAPSAVMTKTPSGQVALEGAGNQAAVYVAFHYTAAGTANGTTALWQIDDLEVKNAQKPALTLIIPGTINEGVGGASGTVSIPTALASDLVVSISSADGTALTVDGGGGTAATTTVTIAAGTTSAGFFIDAALDNNPDSDQTVVLTASVLDDSYEVGTASIIVKNVDLPRTDLLAQGYAQTFSTLTAATPALPSGWTLIGSVTSFPTDTNQVIWGTGTSGGLRGGGNVLGYQHTGSTGILQKVLTLRNATESTIDAITISYKGRVSRVTEARDPSYTVSVNGQTNPTLSFSTLESDLTTKAASFTGLGIAPGGLIEIRWSSANQTTITAGSSRQIGLSDVSVTLGANLASPTLGVLALNQATLSQTAATISASVVSDGGSPVTERGLVYAATSQNADPAVGGANVTKLADAINEIGAFTNNLTGLTANTAYGVKAYAINSVGTNYSSLLSFTTLKANPSFTGVYTQNFTGFSNMAALPEGWRCLSSSNVNSYVGDWSSTSSSGGFYGSTNTNASGVLGYLHTASTGILTNRLTLVNGTGSTLTNLYVSYKGQSTLNDNIRYPAWTVKINDVAVAELAYTTENGIDEIKNAQVTGLSIADGASFTLTWESDRGTGSGAARRIGLTDVRVATTAPNFAPTDIGLTATSIAENNAVDANVGTLSTTDADTSDTHTYSLVAGTGDTDNSSFNISGTSLRASAAFDFETKSSYSIRVRTTDSANNTFDKVFTITVTDANDPPSISSLGTVSMEENQTAVQTVTGSDPDAGATLAFSIAGGADSVLFAINGTSGALTFVSAPDFELPGDAGTDNVYNVTVQVSDGSLSATKDVAVTVTNVNEAPADPLADYLASFNLTGADALGTADPDGDGMDNNAELAFGTDPTNGASRAATLATGTGTIKLVYLQRNSGVAYTVKSFTDLSTAFDSGGTPITPTATDPQPAGVRTGYTQYEASLSTGSSKGFLRVKAVR